MEANPELVKARVFPMRPEVTEENLDEALKVMDEMGLIVYYGEPAPVKLEPDKTGPGSLRFLQIVKANDMQSFHGFKKHPSILPAYDPKIHIRFSNKPAPVKPEPAPVKAEPDKTGPGSIREGKRREDEEEEKRIKNNNPPYPPLKTPTPEERELSNSKMPERGKLIIYLQEQTTDEMWNIFTYAWQTFTIKPLTWNTMKLGLLKERLISFSPDQIKTAISNLASDKFSNEKGFAKFDWLIKSDENVETWAQHNPEQAKKETEKSEINLSELAREIDERLVPGFFDRRRQMLYTLEGKEKQLADRGFLNPEVQAHMIHSVGFQEICDSTGNIFFALLSAGKNYIRSRDRGGKDMEDKTIGREEAKEILGNISNLTKGL